MAEAPDELQLQRFFISNAPFLMSKRTEPGNHAFMPQWFQCLGFPQQSQFREACSTSTGKRMGMASPKPVPERRQALSGGGSELGQ